MTDVATATETVEQAATADEALELEALKTKADRLGLKYSNAIRAPALRDKIREKLEEGEPEAQVELPVQNLSLVDKQALDLERLIRVRITNNDPKKNDLQAEFFTVCNSIQPKMTVTIPLDDRESWHLPYWVIKRLSKKTYLQVRTKKNPRTGMEDVETKWAPEYSFEFLEPLTETELKQLATAQMAEANA